MVQLELEMIMKLIKERSVKMHILFIVLIGISQVVFCIYLYVMLKKRKELFLNMEKAKKEAEKRRQDFLEENRNIEEEYQKVKKINNE